MIKKSLFFLLILCSSMIFAESYITNIEAEPGHANLNHEGSLKIFYDLSKPDLVKKAYLQTEIEGTVSTFETTVTDSGFLSIDNSLTLSGDELYKVIKERRSLEEDDIAKADGTYNIRVRIELDTSSNKNDDNDDDENDDDDDDNDSETIPEYAEKSIKVIFDNKAPKAPSAIEVEGGNQQMLIRITPPSTEDGESKEKIGKYHAKVSGVFKSGDDAETQTTLEYDSVVDSDKYNQVWEFTVKGKNGYEFINNDEGSNSRAYTVEVTAEDLAGNSDENATISVDASAVTTYGFWSNYKSQGGKDDGGFCFVATAGFGSYFHPSVELLREFRDSVLANFSLGKKFIAAYYKYGSYPAEIIKDSSILRAASRTMLMPLVVTAWFFTTVLGRILMISWLFLSAFFAFKSGRKAFLALLFVILMASPIQDLTAKTRGNAIHGEASFTNLIYYPQIDADINGTPFKDVAGPEVRWLPSLTFGLAIPTDYIRITFIGGIGYTRFKGRAMRSDGSRSTDRTTMHFIPLKAELKLRPVYDFPLYPYIAGGLDYYPWWVRDGGHTTENGGTFGLHGTVGLMLSLNWMDPSSSKKMKENGVVNTCLFVGYKFEKINDFWRDKSFDLSNKMKYNFEFGIIFEF